MKESNKKFLKEVLIILVIGLVVNGLLFFFCAITGHCENVSDTILPYNCANFANTQTCLSQGDIDFIINELITRQPQNSNYMPDFDGTDVILWIDDANSSWIWVNFIYKPTLVYPLTPSDSFDFSSNYITLSSYSNYVGTFVYNSLNGNVGGVTFTYGGNVNFCGSSSSRTSDFGIYLPRYPFYYNGQPIISDNNKEVFISRFGNISVGDFIDLPELDSLLNNISNNWSDSSDPILPSVDSSLSVSENLRNMLSTLQSALVNSQNNIGNSLKQYMNNIQQKLTDVANAILGGIYNGFKTINDNFKDFFGAKLDYIIDKIGYIVQPLDSSTVLSGLQAQDFYSDFNDLKNYESSISSLLDISEPTDFSLVLHLGQIDDDFISICGDQEIDISFLHNSIMFRSFCWVVVCSGLTFIVASGIPSMLRGDKGD